MIPLSIDWEGIRNEFLSLWDILLFWRGDDGDSRCMP